MKIEKNKQTPDERCYRIRFTSCKNPFLIVEQYCKNLWCDCNEAILNFIETDELQQPIINPIRFNIYLNLETGQENKKQERHENVQLLVDEFINDLSDETKTQFKKNYNAAKENRVNVENFLNNKSKKITKGNLVSYSEVFSDKGGMAYGGRGAGFSFNREDDIYYIDDLYCINPDCECKEVKLVFFRLREQTGQISQSFDATITLNGKFKIEDNYECTGKEARNIVDEWKRSDRNATEVLKKRYAKMKEIGQRLFKKEMGEMRKTEKKVEKVKNVEKKEKIGRNMPCPCGSGKKYKKCCGKM